MSMAVRPPPRETRMAVIIAGRSAASILSGPLESGPRSEEVSTPHWRGRDQHRPSVPEETIKHGRLFMLILAQMRLQPRRGGAPTPTQLRHRYVVVHPTATPQLWIERMGARNWEEEIDLVGQHAENWRPYIMRSGLVWQEKSLIKNQILEKVGFLIGKKSVGLMPSFDWWCGGGGVRRTTPFRSRD